MQRRTFIKTTAAAGSVTLITPRSIIHSFSNSRSEDPYSGFADPSRTYRPFTWWHWMNGNVTKKGITLDLEAMKAVGLGGFQMFEAGIGIPAGPITYLSEKWLVMVKHTIDECERLDLEFGMHNCPGWSSSGGPWVTPELSMQQFTYSEVSIEKGGPIKIKIPEPPKKLNFYKDSIVVAFPTLPGEGSWVNVLKRFTINDQLADIAVLAQNGSHIQPAISLSGPKSYLTFEFGDLYNARSVTVFFTGKGRSVLQTSDDGKSYSDVAEIGAGGSYGAGNNSYDPATTCFPLVISKYFRFEITGEKRFSSIWFSGEDRLPYYMAKANVPHTTYGYKELVTITGPSSAIDPATVIDISKFMDADSFLNWTAPEGAWTIIRLGHTLIGIKNHSAPTSGTGLECDKFSREAFDHHWHHMFKELLPFFKILKGGKVGMLIDSYEMNLQNWSATFPLEFNKRQQYSIYNYLPALTGRIVKDQEATEKFLWDLRTTQADVMTENYYGRFAELCKQNNIISYTEPYSGGNFEEMQAGRTVDIPMGEFWFGLTRIWNNMELQRTLKLASSIAHSTGQAIVAAEAYTAEPGSGKWQEYPYAMKALGDHMFTKGLTRIVFHRFAHQPHPTALPGMTMGPFGIHFDRTNTWFAKGHEWIKYLSRCQFALRQGTFAADLAYYVGEDIPARTIIAERTNFPPPIGFDHDLVNKGCILNDCVVKNGKLTNQYGGVYSILILPDNKMISYGVLKKIQQFVADGLIVIGERPVKNTDTRSDKIVSDLWGDILTPGVTPCQYSKGRVYWPNSVDEVLADIKLEADFSYTSGDADRPINFIHRKIGDDDLYFIANRRRTKENIVASFRVAGKHPQLWDPMTGKISEMAVYEQRGARIAIPLSLEPSGSIIIVFKPGNIKNNWVKVSKGNTALIDTRPFEMRPKASYQQVFSGFTIEFWVKPEIDIVISASEMFGKFKTDHYVIFPAAGGDLYGNKHGCCGLTIGRNGIGIYEREGDEIKPSLLVNIAISGWSHIAVVYTKNTPAVFLNGKLITKGRPSELTIHPSGCEAYGSESASYYNGEMTEVHVISEAISETAVANLYTSGLPDIPAYQDIEVCIDDARKLLVWKNGHYKLTGVNGQISEFKTHDIPDVMAIKGPWEVTFPADLGAPEKMVMPELVSLHKHVLDGVKFFSGTSTYSTTFQLSPLSQKNKKVFIDLGRVEVLAEVFMNGIKLPILWAPPFRADITSLLRPGNNYLKVKVTNLWPNRLIGDEFLPEENPYSPGDAPQGKDALTVGKILKLPDWYLRGEPKPKGGRITFATWKHYNKNSPLLESGLLGPAKLVFGEIKQI